MCPKRGNQRILNEVELRGLEPLAFWMQTRSVKVSEGRLGGSQLSMRFVSDEASRLSVHSLFPGSLVDGFVHTPQSRNGPGTLRA